MNLIVAIADEFEEFSKNPGLIRYSDLIERLCSKDASLLLHRCVIAGQGLNDMEIDYAYFCALRVGLTKEFKYWRYWHTNPRANCSLSHKQKPENVLISEPQRFTEDRYHADLLFNSRSELMRDHLTGQHVQGMVLIEACRQMFLAVTERFCLVGFPATKRYFAINSINVRYLEFAFPLPSEIRYQLRSRQQIKSNRIAFEAEMEIWQNERPVTGMVVHFTVFDADSLTQSEATLAGKALARCMNIMTDQIESSEGINSNVAIMNFVMDEL